MVNKQEEEQNSKFNPFRYIFYAFFQPARLTRELQPSSQWKRFTLMLRLAIPMFLVAYSLALGGEAILYPFGLLRYKDTASLLFIPVGGTAGGIVLGIVGSIVFGIVLGIVGNIVFDTASDIVFGIMGGIALGIALGIVGSITLGIVGGIALGIALSIALTRGVAFFTGGMISGVVLGIVLGIVFPIAFPIGNTIGISAGIFLGLYRIPLYIISGPSALRAYFVGRERSHGTLKALHRSSLHWDERVYLPLPFLKRTLLIAYDEDPNGTLAEIAFIAAERPLQIRAARGTALEIIMRDLESCKTLQQIAAITQRLNAILPPETNISDSRWANTLPKLSNTSREAMRSMQPIGKQNRLKALDKMMGELTTIRPNVAFHDQQLNARLKQVITAWLAIAQTEHARIERAEQDIGNIDNPYKPGLILEPHDPLFVGRRDLAQQLEHALSKESHHPTLLLQGERRMGKTSALQQLSYLLGASYIPVLYNLQDPKLYARTTTLLGAIASGIRDQLLKRGIEVENIPSTRLQGSRDINEPTSYSIFDRWLKVVEAVLEKEDRLLLLAFDEFEKLDEAGEKEYLDLTLFLDWCRQIIQYHPRIILLFSGVHTFSDMGTKTGLNWSNYFVNVQTIKVSFLHNDEAYQLVIHPRPEYPGEEIFGEVVEQILLQTNRHPFLIQALCSQLVDNLNIEKAEQAEPSHITQAIEQIVDSWDGYFDDLWKRSDEPQRACLTVLDTQQHVTPQDIQQYSQLDEHSIQKALRTLLRRDLVIRNDDTTTYRIAAPIFNQWVKHNV